MAAGGRGREGEGGREGTLGNKTNALPNFPLLDSGGGGRKYFFFPPLIRGSKVVES